MKKESKGFLEKLILGAIVIEIMNFLFSGFYVRNFFIAIAVAVVLSILNKFVKPVLTIISLPATILTLGLFQLVINGFILYLASALLYPDFMISSFGLTIVCSVLISILYSAFGIDDDE